jgi:hypothetical protein
MITPNSLERFSRETSDVAYSDGEVTSHHLTARANATRNSHEVEVVAPERALAAGVLRQATADLRRFRNSKDAVGREMHADAYSWFIANDTEWPCSFCNVCRVLGLSTEAVLDEVLADAGSTWYSHSRRIARSLAQSVKVSLSALFTDRRAQSFASAKS